MNTQKTGEFIKALRKESNLTQAELARKLSCTDKAISRWETGKGLPDADMLLSLSGVFSVSINEILLGERFSFAKTPDDVTTEAVTDSRIIEEIISHTDETIVDILKDKEQQITKTNRSVIHLMVTCCIQILILFVIPEIVLRIKPYSEPILVLIYGSLINFFFAGLIKDKTKWLFPLFSVICMLAPILTDGKGDIHVYMSIAPIFGVASAVIMGFVSGVRYLIKKSRN